MKPTLQLKLSQQLKLTPQLQQSIRLLQMSTIDLNQEIERVIQENPLLELAEDWNTSETEQASDTQDAQDVQTLQKSEDRSAEEITAEAKTTIEDNNDYAADWPQEHHYAQGTRDDEHESPQMAAKPLSLREHLNLQVSLSQISEHDRNIVGLLIDSLDDDGYLMQDLDELIVMLPSELQVSKDDLHLALEYLQHLDPVGVGARDLRECLILQLRALPEDTVYRSLAMKVVKEYLDVLAVKDFVRIKKLLKCGDQALRSIRQLITNLNPKPGSLFNVTDARYIVPDIVVSKIDGAWVANLNLDAIPKLSINSLYASMLKYKRDESSRGLASQLTEAKWLIKNIQQRSITILNVANAIVERQHQFFEHGAVAMRPLVLREIADSLGLHESTISRVTTQKFMYTPRGIFELKYFFGSHVATDTGGACSATAIRALIKQLVQAENQKKPLSDNRISLILEQQGIVVARRTIAKYRESMQIPPANLRKTF
jgi:RNA polymerase sigma-54 factor